MPSDGSVVRHTRKHPIGRRDQAPGEGDSLRLVAVEERRVRPPVQNGGEFPGEVYSVPYAGVHTLSTHGTMDVRGVAEQERTPVAEMIGDPMVHAVRREPVHALDVDRHPLDHTLAHVVPRQGLVLVFGFLADRPDETRTPLGLQRKNGEKIGRVQGDVHLAVHRRSVRLHVGDIEEVGVRAARKTDLQRLPHGGMGAVAPGNVGRLARLRGSIRPFQSREHMTGRLLEAEEFRPALDLDAEFGQAIDQQTLVLVLGKDQRVRERAEACAQVAEEHAGLVLAGHPEIRGDELPSTLDDRAGEAGLTVQLERARLHGNCARRRLRLRLLVHDPHAHTPPRQP